MTIINNHSELHCGDCSTVIAYYHSGSGAPHYHVYLCESCAIDQAKEEEEEEEESENGY